MADQDDLQGLTRRVEALERLLRPHVDPDGPAPDALRRRVEFGFGVELDPGLTTNQVLAVRDRLRAERRAANGVA